MLLVLTVVAAGAALFAVRDSPTQVGLQLAVTNTQSASNYTSVLSTSGISAQAQHLVYQAPQRIGGYIDTGKRRIYVAVINSVEYQSTPVSPTSSSNGLTFVKQPSQPAQSYDPVRGYLPYAAKATHVIKNGDVYRFSVTKQTQTAHFTVTVSGRYVSQLTIGVAKSYTTLTISNVNSSPPVALPPGAKVSSPTTGSSVGG